MLYPWSWAKVFQVAFISTVQWSGHAACSAGRLQLGHVMPRYGGLPDMLWMHYTFDFKLVFHYYIFKDCFWKVCVCVWVRAWLCVNYVCIKNLLELESKVFWDTWLITWLLGSNFWSSWLNIWSISPTQFLNFSRSLYSVAQSKKKLGVGPEWWVGS
jgi:hypothetical protein